MLRHKKWAWKINFSDFLFFNSFVRYRSLLFKKCHISLHFVSNFFFSIPSPGCNVQKRRLGIIILVKKCVLMSVLFPIVHLN